MPKQPPLPDFTIFEYKSAPKELRTQCSVNAQWLLVASASAAEGFQRYLIRARIPVESVTFDDGRVLFWGGPEVVAAVMLIEKDSGKKKSAGTT